VSATARNALAASLPAIGAALLPKCPLCLLAVASSIGVEISFLGSSLMPLLVIALALSVTLIVRAARRNGQIAAAVMAGTAAALLIAQRAWSLPSAVGHGAVLVLVLAAVITAQPRGAICHPERPNHLGTS
jgi:hypothetical protein